MNYSKGQVLIEGLLSISCLNLLIILLLAASYVLSAHLLAKRLIYETALCEHWRSQSQGACIRKLRKKIQNLMPFSKLNRIQIRDIPKEGVTISAHFEHIRIFEEIVIKRIRAPK